MTYRTQAVICGNGSYAHGRYASLLLSCPAIARRGAPGQFVDIRVTHGYEPLVRRPLGIHGVCGDRFSVLFEIVGKGTELLAGKKRGDELDVVGPLGNGFCVSGSHRPILVAGGMGVAPLLFLAQRLKEKGAEKPLVFIGAQTKHALLCEKEFKGFGCAVRVATDDGSKGYKGYVTDALGEFLASSPSVKRPVVYGCGPEPMLRALSRLTREQGIRAQLSLEAHMACGIGACLGCVVDTVDGYQRVCKEGPVFDADRIRWKDEAGR